jgi:arylsulfatase
VGRIIQFLKDADQLENTLIVFMSDNGAAGEDFYNRGALSSFIQKNFDNSYDNMGKTNSFVSYGPQWAQAGAAPFKLWKGYAAEGGIVAPLIISGKWVKRKPGIENVLINVTDLAPSFLELAGIHYPETYNKVKLYKMEGESFLPFIEGKKKSVHNSDYIFAQEHYGTCMLIKGNWKITNISDPFNEAAFTLHDLSKDRGETTDLSKKYPKKYKELLDEWERFKKNNLVVPLEKGEAIRE